MGGHEGPRAAGGAASALDDTAECERLRRKLLDVAWYRYRIPADPAEDAFQAAFATFLEVKDSYGPGIDPRALLAGIFRNKCLEHIDRSVREKKKLRTYCASADAGRENAWIRPRSPGEARSVVDEIVRDEDGREIRAAIERLRPLAREIATLMDREGLDRAGLIERLKLNKNTVDSRLHACRRELRSLLCSAGFAI